MTDRYGRPLARPQNISEADALARRYHEGHLPTRSKLVEERQELQFDELEGEDAGYYLDEERIDAILSRMDEPGDEQFEEEL